MGRPRTARCGTPSGYRRHQNDDEKPCDACVRAKAEADKRWRDADGNRQRNRLYAKAQQKAVGDLTRRHKPEYDALYRTWKVRLFAEEGIDL